MCTRAVGALAHYLEDEGIPTTQISLIRMHTECIKPPRALWVPFELGRPFGIPGDHAFQKRVLLQSLQLLEEPSGPVLHDFPEEAPPSGQELTALSCPVNFVQEEADLTETEQLFRVFSNEIVTMRPWHDMVVEKRGRSTTGISGIPLDTLAEFIFSFLREGTPENPRDDISLGYALKLAADDLKAYYTEGITAQPGQEHASSQVLSDWFWDETAAGKVLLRIKTSLENSEDPALKIAGRALLVPMKVADALAEK